MVWSTWFPARKPEGIFRALMFLKWERDFSLSQLTPIGRNYPGLSDLPMGGISVQSKLSVA